MATLTSSYQYLGRSGKLGSTYYLLVYAKTTPNTTTGIHRVYVQVKFASTQAGTTFYSFPNTIKATVNGSNAFSVSKKPSSAWANTGKITVGGTTYGASVTIGTGYVDVDCTNGLSKSITIKATYTHGSASASYTPAASETDSYSGSHTLSAIIRKAQFTAADDFNDEGNPTITYKNDASSVTTAVQAGISFDGSTMVVPYRDVTLAGGTYTFNLTDAERTALRNGCSDANSKTVQFLLKSTVGETNFTDSISKTLTIINATPTATWTGAVEKDPAILASTLANLGSFLKGVSDVQMTVTPSLKKGATLASVRFNHNGSFIASNPATFSNIQSSAFECVVTDSRGNQVTISKNVSLLDYVILNITDLDIHRDTAADPTKIMMSAKINYFNNSFSSSIVNGATLTLTNSAGTSKAITNYSLSGNTIIIDEIETGFTLAEASTDTYTLSVSDKVLTSSVSKKVSLLIPTLEMGQYDVQVNGDLYIASTTRTNPVNVLSRMTTIAEDAAAANNYINSILYPVGSVVCLGKNSSNAAYKPADLGLPGTWELIDKEFAPTVINLANNSCITKTNLTSYSGYAYLTGHTINIKCALVPSANLSDTAVTLGTLSPTKCGCTNFSCAHYCLGYGDGANGAAMLQMTYQGVISCVDLIDLSSYAADGDSFRFDVPISCTHGAMIDSFCNKFYYKRTA